MRLAERLEGAACDGSDQFTHRGASSWTRTEPGCASWQPPLFRLRDFSWDWSERSALYPYELYPAMDASEPVLGE